jgi:glycosyltransferase involved in cell wall biosynthesis
MIICEHGIIQFLAYIKMLSIVVPVYNHLDLTMQCIKNIEETQEFDELIIVNDGSSDWTREWLDENKKEKWVVIHQENKWTNWARNAGAAVARWDYIAVLNNDLVLPNWALQKMVSWLSDDVWMVNLRSTTLKIKDYWTLPFYFANHIQWRCWIITKEAKEKLFPIDTRLRIFWWDNWLFFKMIYLWKKLKIKHDVIIHHLESQTVDVTKNTDRPIFFQIAKEEWWYVAPVDLANKDIQEDLTFWL